jgi:hypothetical protein
MWAPADLFSPALSIFLRPMKRVVSYFYERLMVLALTLLCVAALITIVTMMLDRRSRRG